MPAARRRLSRALPVIIGGGVWFLASSAPLALLLPDWNSWRTTIPSLGLGFAFAGWLGLVGQPLVAVLVGTRLVLLLVAPPAPAVVTDRPPESGSSFSFVRLVRLQRTVESTRRALRACAVARGDTVFYWALPRMAEVGFAGSSALRVWTGDTTLAWASFGSGPKVTPAVVVEYELGRPWPATRLAPEAVAAYFTGMARNSAGDLAAADSLMREAGRLQPGNLAFHDEVRLKAANIALRRGDAARAESLIGLSAGVAGSSSNYWATACQIALVRGDVERARDAVGRCLRMDPHNALGRELAQTLSPDVP
jgi:hypothetical protein